MALPTDAGARNDEHKSLIANSAVSRLSQQDDARLTKLAEARLAAGGDQEQAASELAAHGRALGLPNKPPGEYQRLIEKSAGAGLNAAEAARLNDLAEQRAIAAGLMDDPASPPDNSEGMDDV